MLAYHSTRLLPHEEDAIARDGLRPASEYITRRQLRLACKHGYLTGAERDELERLAPLLKEDTEPLWRAGRERGVYLLMGRRSFDDALLHIFEWLSTWGGPSLYESCPYESNLRKRLRSIGRPSVYAVALDFRGDRFHPPGATRFVEIFSRAHKARRSTSFEVCYGAPVEGIVDVWHPGDDEYDRHTELPQC